MEKYKKIFIILLIILLILIIFINVKIIKKFIKTDIVTGSGFEEAYIIWKSEDSNLDYDVYIRNTKDKEYEKLDKELIREEDGYLRADAVGLEEGEYEFKIVPRVKEENKEEIVSRFVKVEANVREGFSFSKNSEEKEASGGYLNNGTVAEDAKIIYITKENVNNVKLDIIDNTGYTKTSTGLCEILKDWNQETKSKHLIIRIIGKIEREDIEGLEEKNKAILIDSLKGVTIEGIGNNVTLKGIGLLIRNSSNIEVRNLGFMLYYEDAISIEKNSHNIWIHNNDFFYGEDREKEEADKNKGDGAIDIKQGEYITISYNHFWDNGKTSLAGIDKDTNYITYHHNWFDHCDARCPRVYYASSHVYNNYYVGNSSYGVAAVEGASVFLECNYFKNCRRPMIIANQGSSKLYTILDNNIAGGMIKSYGNIVIGARSLIYSPENSKEFDAYIVNNRDDIVPSNYKTVKGDFTYNNFDTDVNIMYKYNADDAKDIRRIVIKSAGRLQGGDIKFNTSELDTYSRVRTTEMERKLDKLIENY